MFEAGARYGGLAELEISVGKPQGDVRASVGRSALVQLFERLGRLTPLRAIDMDPSQALERRERAELCASVVSLHSALPSLLALPDLGGALPLRSLRRAVTASRFARRPQFTELGQLDIALQAFQKLCEALDCAGCYVVSGVARKQLAVDSERQRRV